MKIMSVRNCLPTMSHLPSTTNPKKRSQFVIWKMEAAEREKIQRETAKQKVFQEIETKRREADEACMRIKTLPNEIKCFILHFLDLKKLELLQMDISTLRSVLQAGGSKNTKELVKSIWLPRILKDKDAKLALHSLGKKANLLPACPVAQPSPYWHRCTSFCVWFAPAGGWDAFHATRHKKCGMYQCIDFD